MYHSEHKQDKWLNENIFKNKKNGVFVEFGAIDGIITSNTLFFEKTLNWSGLCIEPIPEQYKNLCKNRTCICLNYAISNYVGEAKFNLCKDVIGWSGIVDNLEPQHKDRLKKKSNSIITVPVETINRLLERFNFKDIDYMIIDTEGSEKKIIRNFDFDKFNVKIFDIENNYDNYDIIGFMKSKGYELITRLEINDIFVRIQ